MNKAFMLSIFLIAFYFLPLPVLGVEHQNYALTNSNEKLRRNAGDEWSRKKIVEYLKKYYLKLAKRGNYDYVIEDCKAMLPKLELIDFEFVKPDLVADDWGDARLEPYKERHEFMKYGRGYTAGSGERNSVAPTRNINIYNVDINRDGENETIFYGERLRLILDPENDGYRSSLSPAYLIFPKKNDFIKGAGLFGDPFLVKEKNLGFIFSGIVKIGEEFLIVVLNDNLILTGIQTLRLNVYQVSRQVYEKGKAFGSYLCVFELIER